MSTVGAALSAQLGCADRDAGYPLWDSLRLSLWDSLHHASHLLVVLMNRCGKSSPCPIDWAVNRLTRLSASLHCSASHGRDHGKSSPHRRCRGDGGGDSPSAPPSSRRPHSRRRDECRDECVGGLVTAFTATKAVTKAVTNAWEESSRHSP